MENASKRLNLLNSSSAQPFVVLQKLAEIPSAGHVNLENVEDFTTVCRTCATITELVIPIFSGEGLQNNLAEKINKHLPIRVSEEDELPQAVCYQCAHTLLAWHELVACCGQANSALRTRHSQLKASKQRQTRNEDMEIIENKTQNKLINNDIMNFEVELKLEEIKTEPIEKPTVVSTLENGKKYGECQYCQKNILLASWKRHIRSHHGEKRFSCHSCGLSFSESGNFNRHIRAIHVKQRPHTCPICRKTFSRNSHLEDHIKSHSESRDFVCDVCGKASKSSVAFRMHKKTHESNYKFECMECGSKFKRRAELRAHVSVHTGEKAHVCPCGKSFRLRSQLTAHFRRHKPPED